MSAILGKIKTGVLTGVHRVREFDYKTLLLDPFPFLGAWIIMAIVSIAVPLARWNSNRQNYYNYYGYAVEYEQQQRAYEEANNNNNNQYQWNYNSNCSWWNWGCRKRAYDYNYRNNNDDKGDQIPVPSWYVWLGGKTEEDRREQEEEGSSTTGALKFVYVWTLLMFLGLVVYGAFLVAKGRNLSSLCFGLFVFMQFMVLSLVLLGQGVISTEERDMEDSVYGWYGQMGVLMVYSDFWYFLFSVFGLLALTVRIRRSSNNQQASSTAMSYQQHHSSSYSKPAYTQPTTTPYSEMANNKSSSDEENGAF